MLSIGLTGGIAAGKSLLATRFKDLGAVLIDADKLAREAVAPGTPGLAAVVRHFGETVLRCDGSLDRTALGSTVFGDASAREALSGIVHPLVRAAAQALKDDAGPGTIVVQDIPLLVETGQGPNFHLVVVVQAPERLRLERMVRDRGMAEADALARMAAQASDEQREAVADVVIVNEGSPDGVLSVLDRLWHERLLPYAANLAARTPAETAGGAGCATEVRTPGEAQLKRQRARIGHAVGELAAFVEPEPAAQGSSGAGDCLFLQGAGDASSDRLMSELAGAGFFPLPSGMGGAAVLGSADPCNPVGLRLL